MSSKQSLDRLLAPQSQPIATLLTHPSPGTAVIFFCVLHTRDTLTLFRSIRAYMVPRRGNSGEVQRRGNNGERNLALPSSIVTWDTGRCGACAHLGRPRTGLVPRGWWPGGVTAVGTVSRVYLEWMRLRWTGEGGRGSRAAVNDGLGVGRLMSAWWGESR